MADEAIRRAILGVLAGTPFGSLSRRQVIDALADSGAAGDLSRDEVTSRAQREVTAMVAERLLGPAGDGMWRLTAAGRRVATDANASSDEGAAELDPLPAGSTPEPTPSVVQTPAEAGRRRSELPSSPREGRVWTLRPGQHMAREERRLGYGGSTFRGIEPSAQTPNVFVYSDPTAGAPNGYDFDGWSSDEDVFYYTGEGRRGSQRMESGNKAILRHHEDGRSLRLFVADGTLSGRSAKDHLYLGEFEVDDADPYLVERAPDSEQRLRDVFVFRLLPIGEVVHRVQDGQHNPLGTRRSAGDRQALLDVAGPARAADPARTPSRRDDGRVRRGVAAWLEVRSNGGRHALNVDELSDVIVDGQSTPLVSTTANVVVPSGLDAALSIVTPYTPGGRERPFEDATSADGMLRLAWRGTDPLHPENLALRRAMEREVPLVWLFGVGPSSYLPVSPVFVLAEDAERRQFVVDPDVGHGLVAAGSVVEEHMRRYIVAETRRRLHQPVFRATVLRAYASRCAVCSLRHERLLDAAHIIPDSDPRGIASVRNGLALCKIHHAAYDADILAVRPDRTDVGIVEIRADLLAEVDGPMLRHGLQDHHGQPLRVVPAATEEHPDSQSLQRRYEQFRAVG